jgi:hypothetical protein
MVRVKRGGKFVTVKPGQSLGRSGGRPGVSVPKSSGRSSSGGAAAKAAQEKRLIEKTRAAGIKKLELEAAKLRAGKQASISRDIINKYLLDKTRKLGRARVEQDLARLQAGLRAGNSRQILDKIIRDRELVANVERKRFEKQKTFDFKRAAKDFKEREAMAAQSMMSIGDTNAGKVTSLFNRYTDNAARLTKDLSNAAREKEITKLAELQRKKNLTASEKKEKERLQKNVSANIRKASELIGNTIGYSVLGLGIGGVSLARQFRADPIGTLQDLPPSLLSGLKNDFKRASSSQSGAITVAVEYLAIGGALKGVGTVGKGTFRTLGKLHPRYVKPIGGEFKFKKSGLKLKEQTVASGASTLAQQAKLAGTTVTAVNAAANRLTSLIKRKQIVRKPIPGENNFPSNIKKILDKFDSGKKLTNKELATVNFWLQKNVAPNITLLERSLYLDPASGLRTSRLGITAQRTATIKDILRGNFTLWNKAGKPQVLIFENVKVANFPKNLLDVKRKLLAGKKLTVSETNRLIKWQVETGSGKFKPIGSTIYAGGKELEVTLAPGEMIKRIKRVGFTYINGKKVEFVTAEIFKPTKTILSSIKKANLGKLTKAELTKLENLLSKKLGRKIKVETPELRKKLTKSERRVDSNTPVLRVRGSGIFVIRRIGARPKVKRGGRTGRTTRTRRIVKPSRVARAGRTGRTGRVSRTAAKRTLSKRAAVKRAAPVRTARTGKTAKTTKPVIIPRLEKFKQRTLSKSQPTYYVVEKVRGKLKKLYPKPLTLKDAKDYAVYSIDNRLSKTAFFVPLGKSKKVLNPPKNIQGYYSKNAKKVRPYKIRMGKKKDLVNGFIEKRKYAFDKPLEKAQAKNLRARKKRKMTPAQRRNMLANLKKARAARMKNLKKK